MLRVIRQLWVFSHFISEMASSPAAPGYRQRRRKRKNSRTRWLPPADKNARSVATTWQTTIEELSRSERKLLNILAWLAPEPIPISLLEGNIVDGADARD